MTQWYHTPEQLVTVFSAYLPSLSDAGSIASLVGLVIGIPALWKKLSNVQAELLKRLAIDDIGIIVTEVDEIKNLHRLGIWVILPAKYSFVRKRLISLKVENPNVTDHRELLQSMIQQFTDMEHKVEKALAANGAPGDIPALNRVLAKQADKLNELVSILRTTEGQNK
jgi:hypothetical protein